jgi:hypothetical protein
MKNRGGICLSFNDIKKYFDLPSDALLKTIEANNSTDRIMITFYTDDEKYCRYAPGSQIKCDSIN